MSEKSKIKWSLFLSGDDEAYNWLYKNHIQILYGYGTRFTTDIETIKDCIQDVFTTIYQHRKNLTAPDNVKVYLMVSLKNNLLRHLQKKELRSGYYTAETIDFSLEPTVEEEYIDNEEQRSKQKKIKEVLSLLTPRQQEIIYYRFIQELSFEDICLLMNLNYQSAQNLIQRSLKKVRDATTSPYLFLWLATMYAINE